MSTVQGGPSDSAVDAALAAMRKRYIENSRGFLSTFEMIGEQLGAAPDSEDLLMSLRRELHRVHGTAGSLGFHEAGRIAGGMEDLVRRWANDLRLDRDRRSTVVMSFTRSLKAAIEVVDADGGDARHIVLLDVPPAVASGLVAEGIQRGFAVERMAASEASAGVRTTAPWGVVAMETGTAAVTAAGFGAVPQVLLRDGAAPGGRRSRTGRVIDAASNAGDVLDLLARQHGMRSGGGGIVLIVDDDPMMQLLLRTLAEDDGFTVAQASSGTAFREILTTLDPTLVVLDYELMDATGVELLRVLRNSPRHCDVPVLMLSGRSDAAARTTAFDAGADDYMVKPLVAPEFQHRIQQLIALRQDRRVATGLHPVSGLPLQARTMQDIESRLASRGHVEWSVGLIRPVTVPVTPEELAAWQSACMGIAASIRESLGVAGFVNDSDLAIAVPLQQADAAPLLESLATKDEGPQWHAGVVGTSALPSPTHRALLASAEDALMAAREAQVSVRGWNPADADIAPDVIIVEDDESLADLLAFALTARGLSHRTYNSGPAGLAALLRLKVHNRPRIVLLDVDLPGMDGHSLHERIRIERPGNFHVVFISLHTSEADQLRALQGGALDYLTKPVSVRVLMAKLTAWRERTKGG